MKENVSITKLFVYFLMQWKKVLVLALVLGLLAGIVRIGGLFPEYRHSKDATLVEADEDLLNIRIDHLKKSLEDTKEYWENSEKMKINPYSVAVSTINILISFDDDEDFGQTFEYDTTPISYMTAKVQGIYSVLWSEVDSTRLDGLEAFGEDRYVKELVSILRKDGGILQISARGRDEETASVLAHSVYSYLLSKKADIAEMSYEHSIGLISDDLRIINDPQLLVDQEDVFEQIETLPGEIKALESEQNSHTTQITIGILIKSGIKYSLIGLMGGILLGWIYLTVVYVCSDIIIDSTEITRTMKWESLGVKKINGFLSFIKRMLGLERKKIANADTLNYCIARLNGFDKENIIVISSTLARQNSEVHITELKEHLERNKFKVIVEYEFLDNYKALEMAQQSGELILVEAAAKTSMKDLREVENLCKRNHVNMVGVWLIE